MGGVLLEQRELIPGTVGDRVFRLVMLHLLQGRILANQMHGQALHFKWGDGAKFECKELTQCFEKGTIRKIQVPLKTLNFSSSTV